MTEENLNWTPICALKSCTSLGELLRLCNLKGSQFYILWMLLYMCAVCAD